MSNLTVRILVALVGIPLILLVTMAGGFSFFAFVIVVSSLALTEFYALARAKGAFPQTVPGLLFGFCLGTVFIFARLRDAILGFLVNREIGVPSPTMAQYFLILFLLFVPIMLLVELFRNKGSAILNVAVTVFGAAYVSLFFGALIGVRELYIPEDFPVYLHFPVHGASVADDVRATIDRWGGLTVLAIFVSIWMCDSGAYFAGRAFGKHKLFERVSPKKTWEGAIAGFIFAVLAFVAARQIALPYMTVTNAVVCGAIVGIFGQLGDLAESLLKRDAGVKDSSSLIPGHGGVLDRFDSLMFVSPLLFFYLDFIVF